MKKPYGHLLILCLLSTSCGIFETLKRHVASDVVAPKLNQEIFVRGLDERLKYLHHYYLMGLVHLERYEKSSESNFTNTHYLALEAIKSQVDEIEKEVHRMGLMSGKHDLLKQKIQDFSKLSTIHSLAMENLSFRLGVPSQEGIDITPKELAQALDALKDDKDFFISEKNVEHLAHMMEARIEISHGNIHPSPGKNGNITGDEFPAKVWSLTFEDGPMPQVTLEILKALNDRQMKATFFSVGSRAQEHPEVLEKLKSSGMEIASHSWSHLPLSKISENDLEEEVHPETAAKFFRLPYGDGIQSPNIREKIAEKNLIHVLWNVDALDWLPQSPLRIALRTKALMKKNKKDSGIILMHDTHPRSIIAASLVMDFLSQNGRRNCRIGEIVIQLNEGAKTVCSK